MAQDLFGTFESQRDFAAVYESIETEYRCASCGYEWSGSPNSTVPDDAPRFREVIEKIETLFGEQEVPTTVPIVYPYRCPKCRHEWTGDPKPKGASSPEPDALEFGKVGDRTARGIIIREEAVEKPPYRVPLMREIHAMPWNGFNAVGTFSGCGGSDTGVKMAGFRVLWASEFIPAAQECFRQNHPGTILDGRDIRQVQPEEIEKAIGLKGSDIDLFFGSPPCSDFSTAGKRDEGWGKVKNYSDSKQRVDDLFFEFARLLKGLQPKTFFAENVSGLVKGVAKGYFKEILAQLKACGYRVSVKVLDAQYLGVPQMRQRTIFVGVREDLVGVEPAFPEPLPYSYTVRDALPCGGFVEVERIPVRAIHDMSGLFSQGDITDQLCPAITVGVNALNSRHYQIEEQLIHASKRTTENVIVERIIAQGNNGGFGEGAMQSVDNPSLMIGASPSTGNGKFPPSLVEVEKVTISKKIAHSEAVEENVGASLEGYAVGEEWDKLAPGESSDRFLNLVKPDQEKPCPTITAQGAPGGVASVTHPTEKRKFSIAELKRVCAFPDDFDFRNQTYAQAWERMGRAVPPVMAMYIAAAIRDKVLARF